VDPEKVAMLKRVFGRFRASVAADLVHFGGTGQSVKKVGRRRRTKCLSNDICDHFVNNVKQFIKSITITNFLKILTKLKLLFIYSGAQSSNNLFLKQCDQNGQILC
jgi:hypothetical protein